MAREKLKLKDEFKKPKIYYCVKGQYSFTIQDYDRNEFGEIIRNEKGTPKVKFETDNYGNNTHAKLIHIVFERVPVKDPKTGKTNAMIFLGRLIVYPDNERFQDIVNYLENARRNPLSGILTEEEYKTVHNPDAYAFEKKLALYEGENAELKEYNTKLREKLEQLGIVLDNAE